MIISILGGTGDEGRGLSLRLGKAGHRVVIGSRDLDRARAVAAELALAAGLGIEGATNETAAALGQIVILAMPFAGHRDTLEAVRPSLAGKVVIDAVVPLDMQRRHPYAPPEEGSAAEQAQALLPEARVVAALHHVAAHELAQVERAIDSDVLIAGDDAQAKAAASSLQRDLGCRPIDAGQLRHASALEAFTVVLIQMNRRYKCRSSGLRITGLKTA